jgi:hypothetical protein
MQLSLNSGSAFAVTAAEATGAFASGCAAGAGSAFGVGSFTAGAVSGAGAGFAASAGGFGASCTGAGVAAAEGASAFGGSLFAGSGWACSGLAASAGGFGVSCTGDGAAFSFGWAVSAFDGVTGASVLGAAGAGLAVCAAGLVLLQPAINATANTQAARVRLGLIRSSLLIRNFFHFLPKLRINSFKRFILCCDYFCYRSSFNASIQMLFYPAMYLCRAARHQ